MAKYNLVGKKIGMLTVKELVVASPYSKKAYRCVCECGNECTRLEASLLRGNHISSCGCYSQKNLKPGSKEQCSRAGKHRKDIFVNGCNVQMTFREGTIKTNTSGQQGVSWSGSVHKWHVYIGYQNYRANLGYFEDIEDAIRIRKLGEEAIANNEFEEFYFKVRGKHLVENNKYFKNK